MGTTFYESDQALGQYLLFHYGSDGEILPFPVGPREALHFPERCVHQCVDKEALPPRARALDIGCAVGRSSFELARICDTVVGIDSSRAFIAAAQHLKTTGRLPYRYLVQGDVTASGEALVPPEISRERVEFQVGDALHLDEALGTFDVLLAANLIDRVPSPRSFLQQIPRLLRPGGQLIITSPYTWTEEYTPRDAWLSGCSSDVATAGEVLQGILSPALSLVECKNLPFLIREHARKYQWSMAEATLWKKETASGGIGT